MHKFFDYLEPDLPVNVIRDLLGYIRRFAALFSGGVPVEGAMDGVGFCATEQDSGAVRVHWVQVGRQRIRWTPPCKNTGSPASCDAGLFIGSGPARQRSSSETPAAPCPAP